MFEILLDRVFHSTKIKKSAIIFVSAGIIVCIILLFPPVQNAIYTFFSARRRGTSGEFQIKLQTLLLFSFNVFAFTFCCLFSKTISAFLEDVKNTRLIIAAAAGTGALLLGFVTIFSYQHGWQWLNSDHSSEMVLGKLLSEESAFISRNWHYSTEIHLIFPTLFTMPLFKLIGHYENWALIRALTLLISNLVLILSYLFMTGQMKIQTKWICITGFFLIMPLSAVYWDIVTFSGSYILFIAQLFCCLGLFIRLINYTDTAKMILIEFILFTALSFALGIQGIRSLLCVHIPLLITCVYCYSKASPKKSFPLFLGCYGFAVCCAGYAVNFLLVHFWKYSFNTYENMGLTNLYTEFFPRLGQSLANMAEFFGFSAGSSLLSAQGLFSVIAIIGTFILFWAVIKSFRRQTEYQFMTVFFLVSAVFNIFVFIVLDQFIYSRYVIPFMVLYIPLAAILFEHAEKTCGYLKRAAIVSGIVLFVSVQGCLNFQSMAGLDKNSARKGYIQYLLDNQLEYGFATFWNANVTTELSNGKIEMAGLVPQGLNPGVNSFYIQNWLNPVKFYNPSFHQGESFLLLTRDEYELAQRTKRPFALLTPDFEDSDFIVIKFPSAQIIHSEVLDNGG